MRLQPVCGSRYLRSLNFSCISLRGHRVKLEVAKVAVKCKSFPLQPGLVLSEFRRKEQDPTVFCRAPEYNK